MTKGSLDRSAQKAAVLKARFVAARNTLTPVDEALLADDGLTSAQVIERQERGLTNEQQTDSSRSLSAILRANLLTLFNAVVGGSFLLLLFLGQWKDALFGFAVIANVLIGVVQEYRSKRLLDKLSLLHQPRARVRRDGAMREIAVKDVEKPTPSPRPPGISCSPVRESPPEAPAFAPPGWAPKPTPAKSRWRHGASPW